MVRENQLIWKEIQGKLRVESTIKLISFWHIQGQRTVYRLTLVKAFNTEEIEGYAKLVDLGKPGFIEVKVSEDHFCCWNMYEIKDICYLLVYFVLSKKQFQTNHMMK